MSYRRSCINYVLIIICTICGHLYTSTNQTLIVMNLLSHCWNTLYLRCGFLLIKFCYPRYWMHSSVCFLCFYIQYCPFTYNMEVALLKGYDVWSENWVLILKYTMDININIINIWYTEYHVNVYVNFTFLSFILKMP